MDGALSEVWKPHPGQAAFLACRERFRALACGRRWGKTDACAAEIARRLIGGRRDRTLVVAPTTDQARLIFERVLELLDRIGSAARLRQSPHPRLSLGEATLLARSGHRPRSLRGLEADHIVVDEAAFVPDEAIRDVLMPMIATVPDATFTLVSTPNGRGFFREMFARGEERIPGFWSRRAPSAENPRVSAEFLRVQRELLPENAYRREYEAEFADAEGQVFRGEDLERAAELDLSIPADAPRTVGVDWARTTDATAVVVLLGTAQAARVVEFAEWRGMSFLAQCERLAELLRRHPRSRVLMDESGLGLPITELVRDPSSPLRMAGVPIRGKRFDARGKGEMVARLGLLLERGRLAITGRDLLAQLADYRAKLAPSGHLRHEGASGRDDLVCALMLAVDHLPPAHRVPVPIAIGREIPLFGSA